MVASRRARYTRAEYIAAARESARRSRPTRARCCTPRCGITRARFTRPTCGSAWRTRASRRAGGRPRQPSRAARGSDPARGGRLVVAPRGTLGRRREARVAAVRAARRRDLPRSGGRDPVDVVTPGAGRERRGAPQNAARAALFRGRPASGVDCAYARSITGRRRPHTARGRRPWSPPRHTTSRRTGGTEGPRCPASWNPPSCTGSRSHRRLQEALRRCRRGTAGSSPRRQGTQPDRRRPPSCRPRTCTPSPRSSWRGRCRMPGRPW